MVSKIAVIGAGTMGLGIAHVAVLGGYETILQDVSEAQLQKALGTIRVNMQKGVEKGKLSAGDMESALQRLRAEPALDLVARDADFVIEAAPEDMALKCRIFSELDRIAPPHAVFASNTSGLSIRV